MRCSRTARRPAWGPYPPSNGETSSPPGSADPAASSRAGAATPSSAASPIASGRPSVDAIDRGPSLGASDPRPIYGLDEKGLRRGRRKALSDLADLLTNPEHLQRGVGERRHGAQQAASQRNQVLVLLDLGPRREEAVVELGRVQRLEQRHELRPRAPLQAAEDVVRLLHAEQVDPAPVGG